MEKETNDSKCKTPIGIELVCGSTFHRDRCVLCQKAKADKGTKEGISNLKRAAEEKNDVVVKKRIQVLEAENKPFIRHRKCVKEYTYKDCTEPPVIGSSESVDNGNSSNNIPMQMLRRSSL